MSEKVRRILNWLMKAVAAAIVGFIIYLLVEISTAPPGHPIFTAAIVFLSIILAIFGVMSLLT